jgi:hypothetical protein
MTQPTVPFWFVVLVVVLGAVISGALAYQDPAVVIAPLIRFFLFLANIGLLTLAAVLNIKRPGA